jgi:hypothetical protein
MNADDTYIVQCNEENFEEARYHLQMFAHVVDIDSANCCIRTYSLDSTIKRRLGDIGASFWQETCCTIATKSKAVRKA